MHTSSTPLSTSKPSSWCGCTCRGGPAKLGARATVTCQGSLSGSSGSAPSMTIPTVGLKSSMLATGASVFIVVLLFRWLWALAGFEDPGPRLANERWGGLPVCPDDVVEELAEVVRSLLGVELQLDDEVVRIGHQAANPMAHDAGVPARVGESVEGLLPGGKIADCVLDAEGEHPGLRVAVWDAVILRQRGPGGNPSNLGSSTPRAGLPRFG